ncbi:MAG: recombinase family protein, partial [Firmicutes bacterium]|nr:recombinase family protein [Bacillota bacterium]
MAKYVVALYLRLSVEDTKVESMSIESQRLLLNKYAENLAEDTEVVEYVDNGYSGTNFERPAVQELLTDVQNYKINCILVKDFSRFGRNSIEV